MRNIDINKIVVSNKKDVKKIRLLCIFLPKMSAYRKVLDETKYMFFIIKNDESLKRDHKIWQKVKNIIDKAFDSDSVYNEKYLKAKIKSYNGKTNTNFYDNKIPKEVSQCMCVLVLLINFVFRAASNSYPYLLLEECTYIVKKKRRLSILLMTEVSSKTSKYIIDGRSFF